MVDIPSNILLSEIHPDMGTFWELTKQTYFTLGFMLFPVCLILISIFSITSIIYGVKYCISKIQGYDSIFELEDLIEHSGYLLASIIGLIVILIVLPILV